MISLVMALIVMGTVGLGIWIGGTGVTAYLSGESALLMIIAPLAIVMIGVSPRTVVGAFVTAGRADRTDPHTAAGAAAVIGGLGRAVTIAAILYFTIASIAMLRGLGPGGMEHVQSLGAGFADVAVTVFYAVLLHALVLQPLRLRLEQAGFKQGP